MANGGTEYQVYMHIHAGLELSCRQTKYFLAITDLH